MYGIEGLVIAVNDFGAGGIAAAIIIRYIAVFVLHTACRGGIVFLGFAGNGYLTRI